jgi:hypothetical protein
MTGSANLQRGSGSQRRARRTERLNQRTSALAGIAAMSPQQVYAELRGYADTTQWMRRKPWKPGWASLAFKEIFGAWPPWDWRDTVQPDSPSPPICEWINNRPKRPKKKREGNGAMVTAPGGAS